MRKINALICGVASIFSVQSTINVDEIFERYPTNNIKDVKEELKLSWTTVGNTIREAIKTYEQESN